MFGDIISSLLTVLLQMVMGAHLSRKKRAAELMTLFLNLQAVFPRQYVIIYKNTGRKNILKANEIGRCHLTIERRSYTAVVIYSGTFTSWDCPQRRLYSEGYKKIYVPPNRITRWRRSLHHASQPRRPFMVKYEGRTGCLSQSEKTQARRTLEAMGIHLIWHRNVP